MVGSWFLCPNNQGLILWGFYTSNQVSIPPFYASQVHVFFYIFYYWTDCNILSVYFPNVDKIQRDPTLSTVSLKLIVRNIDIISKNLESRDDVWSSHND